MAEIFVAVVGILLVEDLSFVVEIEIPEAGVGRASVVTEMPEVVVERASVVTEIPQVVTESFAAEAENSSVLVLK